MQELFLVSSYNPNERMVLVALITLDLRCVEIITIFLGFTSKVYKYYSTFYFLSDVEKIESYLGTYET
jgi:hypothetical protein